MSRGRRSVVVALALAAARALPGQTVDDLAANTQQLEVKIALDRTAYLPGEAAAVLLSVRNPTAGSLQVFAPFASPTGCFDMLRLSGDSAGPTGDPACGSRLVDESTPLATLAAGEERQRALRSYDPSFDVNLPVMAGGGVPRQPGFYRIRYLYGDAEAAYQVLAPRVEAAARARVEDGSSVDPATGEPATFPLYMHAFALRSGSQTFLCVTREPSEIETMATDRGGAFDAYSYGSFVRVASSQLPVVSVALTADQQGALTLTWRAAEGPAQSLVLGVTPELPLIGPARVTLNPVYVNLFASEAQPFSSASIGTGAGAVEWTVRLADQSPVGLPAGTITQAGVYTAPAAISAPYAVVLTARSQSDPANAAIALVDLGPRAAQAIVAVTVSPTTASLRASLTQQFTAAVTGTDDTDVIWTLTPDVGTIDDRGNYLAPAVVAAQQVITVTATSAADPARSASALVTLVPEISVRVSPLMASLGASQTQQFTSPDGGVSWAVSPDRGLISATGLYTSPGVIPTPETVTVTATSLADSRRTATATVALNPLSIGVSPPLIVLGPGQARQFRAAVSGSSNTAVAWTINPPTGAISASGLYTAPTAIGLPDEVTVTATSIVDGSKSATAKVTLAPPPTLAAVSPSTGMQGASVAVTLTGANFSSGAAVGLANSAVRVINPRVVSPTQITATLVIAADAALGPADVRVILGAASNAVSFTVLGLAPTLTSITPTMGLQGASVPITLTGANFTAGATVATSDPLVTVGNVTVVSASQITATLVIAANAVSGSINVTVTTSGGTSGALPFTIGETISTPAVPTGPATGVSGSLYSYSAAGAVSSFAHKVQYAFDWGDGSRSGWTPNGASSSSHVWSAPGSYSVTVQARCVSETGVVSANSAALVVVITGESITAPATPAAIGGEITGASYTYSTTGGAVSSLGHNLQYQFDFGDGVVSPWLPAGTTSASHTWVGPGTYSVTVRARCVTNTQVVSARSAPLIVDVIAGETISTPATPSGPATGAVGASLVFSSSGAASSLGHAVQYFFDWGDGATSGWLPVGQTSAAHVWTRAGSFSVTVLARCSVDWLMLSQASTGAAVAVQ